jgi:hypothetical protein
MMLVGDWLLLQRRFQHAANRLLVQHACCPCYLILSTCCVPLAGLLCRPLTMGWEAPCRVCVCLVLCHNWELLWCNRKKVGQWSVGVSEEQVVLLCIPSLHGAPGCVPHSRRRGTACF